MCIIFYIYIYICTYKNKNMFKVNHRKNIIVCAGVWAQIFLCYDINVRSILLIPRSPSRFKFLFGGRDRGQTAHPTGNLRTT